MSLSFWFARHARFRAPLLAALLLPVVSCNNDDLLDPAASEAVDETSATGTEPTFNSAYAGGIPYGLFTLPTKEFGSRFNGSMRNIWPGALVKELAAIRARGGKVILMFAGNERHYKERGRFSMRKWQARVNRFRNVNFSSFIRDGTVIGHYLIDEPDDPHNWGRPIPQSTIEEMAKYSKRLWPSMATIVRARPEYLQKHRGNYRYLDAAWAQYLVHRWPNANEFITNNVARARSKGLALVVGLNVIHGGSKRRTAMSAEQIRKAGSALLSNSYPCAFISWQYRSSYMRNRGVQQAMADLRSRARSRPFKSCWGSGRSGRRGDNDGGRDDDD